MKVLLIFFVLYSAVTGQFTAAPPTCPGDTFTFRCTVTGEMSGSTIWRVGVGTPECTLAHTSTSSSICGPSDVFTARSGTGFGTGATSFTSTLSGTATSTLNGTLVECFGQANNVDTEIRVNGSILQILGPPSMPVLSCVDLSEDVEAVNVTVSWTLSGGDSANFYLINITTNAPQTPYGGLVNITTTGITQYELTGFMTGYEYNITVRGVTAKCGGLVGRENEPLTITPQVPMTPTYLNVCAVYDAVNETLRIIESSWNEVDPVTVSEDCANGRDIRASYELSYTTDSGTLFTTCVVNGTECSSGLCHHELHNNNTDSRCWPQVTQFSGEGVTVSLTGRNIVGRSNSTLSRNISGRNIEVYIETTNISSTFVECTFYQPGYTCTIDYGTDPSYTNLVYRDTSSTQGQMATITLSQRLITGTTYYYNMSAVTDTQCIRVQGRFRIGCYEADLIDQSWTANPEQCTNRAIVSGSSISGGVVCYNGTIEGSRAVYICNSGFVLMEGNEETRVCQSDGIWNGSIPQCIPACTLPHLPMSNIALIVIGAVLLLLGIVITIILTVIAVLCSRMTCENECFTYSFMGTASLFCVIGVALWIALAVVASNSSDSNRCDPSWRYSRDRLTYSGFAFSIAPLIVHFIALLIQFFLWKFAPKCCAQDWRFQQDESDLNQETTPMQKTARDVAVDSGHMNIAELLGGAAVPIEGALETAL